MLERKSVRAFAKNLFKTTGTRMKESFGSSIFYNFSSVFFTNNWPDRSLILSHHSINPDYELVKDPWKN